MNRYGMKGAGHRIRLSRRVLSELDQLLGDRLQKNGGSVPDSVSSAGIARSLCDLVSRYAPGVTRYALNLGDYDRPTNIALRDCLAVIAQRSCHKQVQASCKRKVDEINEYLGISAVDQLADLVK